MKLFHLSKTYDYAPVVVETVETDTECQFMGNKTRLRVAKQTPVKASRTLKYRGVSYRA